MAEYEYVKGQAGSIEKKYNELLEKYKNMEQKDRLQIIEKKYNQLMEKKKLGKADWVDEVMIKAYQDVIKMEKDYIK